LTFTVLKNKYKFAQEPVLVQQYFCTKVEFLLHLCVLLVVYLLTDLLLWTLQNLA